MKAQDQKLLQIAQLLSEEEGLSQRDIFHRLGMAQGLVNRYLKLLARKGWIKLTTAPAKRMRYWMTPKGLAEKSRLVLEFASNHYQLFREAHRNASNVLRGMADDGARHIAFHGNGPLAEIAAMSLRENGQTLIAIADPDEQGGSFLGLTVLAPAALAGTPCEGVLLIKPWTEREPLPQRLAVAALLPERGR